MNRSLFILVAVVFAQQGFTQGSLTPPDPPGPTMKTLQEIWDRIGVLDATLTAQQQEIRILRQQNTLLMESTGVPFAWKIVTVDSAGTVGQYASLAFSPGGQPAISYYDGSNFDLNYATFNGTNWQLSTVDSTGGVGQYTSLAFTPGGQPAISYYDSTNQDLKFAVFDGGSWQLTTVDSDGNVGQYTSLAFTPDGQPAISYYDNSNTDLKYAVFTGTNWQTSIVDTNSAGQHNSLAFTPAGRPAIAYAGGADVKYAVFNGNTWSVRTVDIATGQYMSLAFSPAGQPAMSYHDVGGRDLKYALLDGNNWTNAIVDGATSSGVYGRFSSLAFGYDGQPAISYREETASSPGNPVTWNLKLARFNGTAWILSKIPGGGDPEYTSLAFDSEGQPAIAYWDRDGNDLKLARRGFFFAIP